MAAPHVETKPAEFVPAKEMAHVPMQTDLTAEVLDAALVAYEGALNREMVSGGGTGPMTPEPASVLTPEQDDAMADLQSLVNQGSNADGHEVVEALENATAVLREQFANNPRQGGAVKDEHLESIYGGIMRLSEALDEQTRLSEETAEATAKEQASVAKEIRALHGQFQQLVTERDAYRTALEQKMVSGGQMHANENPLRTGGEERLAMWLGDEAAAEAVQAALPAPIPAGVGGALISQGGTARSQRAPSENKDTPVEPSSPLDQWQAGDPEWHSSDISQSLGTEPAGDQQQQQQRSTAEASAAADRLLAEVTAANASTPAPAPSVLKKTAPPVVPLVDASPGEGGGLLMTGGAPTQQQYGAVSSKVDSRLVRFEGEEDPSSGGGGGEPSKKAGGGGGGGGFDPTYRKSWQEPTPPAAPLSPRTRERPRGSQKPPPERRAVVSHKPTFNPSQWEPEDSHAVLGADLPPATDRGGGGAGMDQRSDAAAVSAAKQQQQQPPKPKPPRNTIAGAQPMGLKYVRSKRDGKLVQKMVPIEPATQPPPAQQQPPPPAQPEPAPAGVVGGTAELPDYVKERQRQKSAGGSPRKSRMV